MRRGPAALAILVAAGAALGAWWLQGREPAPVPGSGPGAQLAAARPLSADSGMKLGPRFSPDGAQVAFALAEGGESRIVVHALDGSARRFVGAAGALRMAPAFFPDGRRLAFWQLTEGDCAIVEHDLASGAERELVDCSMAPRMRFDLAPDGRTLVFAGSADGASPAGLWLLRLDDRTLTALTRPGAGAGDDVNPRFSPDGTRVAFFRGAEGRRQPWLVPVARPGEARAIGPLRGPAHGLAWAGPDGPLIVSADWSGVAALHELDLRTGAARAIGAAHARFPDRSVAGDLVYENVVGAPPSNAGGYAEAAHQPAAPSPRIDLAIARR